MPLRLAPAHPWLLCKAWFNSCLKSRCLPALPPAGLEQSGPDPERFKSDVALFFDKLTAETQVRQLVISWAQLLLSVQRGFASIGIELPLHNVGSAPSAQ